MHRALPILLICSSLGIGFLLVWGSMMMQAEVAVNRERYEETHEQLLATTALYESREEHLRQITTSERAVEMEIRRELRMVYPEERLVLITSERR